MKKNIKHTLTLFEYFMDKEKPEIVVKFIYKNIYELVNEIKYIPHTKNFEDFHLSYKYAYEEYYNKIVELKIEDNLVLLFPNPNYTEKFSFKNFYLGLIGRLVFMPSFYGDPISWNIGYYMCYSKTDRGDYSLGLDTRQYILLDNYSTFQIEEEYSQEMTLNYLYVIYKKANKYPGQPHIPLEVTCKYEDSHKYGLIDKDIDYFIGRYRDYKFGLDFRIIEACNIVLSRRKYRTGVIKPLYLCIEELEEELKKMK